MRKMQKLCEIKILVLKNFSHLSCVWNIHVFCYAPNRAAIEKPENFISLLWVRKAKFSQHSDERRQRHCAEKISKERCDVSRWQIYFMAISIFSSSWFKTSHLFPIPLTTQFQQQQTCREIFLIQFLLFAFSCKRLLILSCKYATAGSIVLSLVEYAKVAKNYIEHELRMFLFSRMHRTVIVSCWWAAGIQTIFENNFFVLVGIVREKFNLKCEKMIKVWKIFDISKC